MKKNAERENDPKQNELQNLYNVHQCIKNQKNKNLTDTKRYALGVLYAVGCSRCRSIAKSFTDDFCSHDYDNIKMLLMVNR